MELLENINWKDKKILVIGEASIDKYILGTANSISPDAPVPNIKINENQNYIGGIGLAIQYIKSLGGKAEVCTVLGNDYDGDFFLKKIKQLKIETSGIIIDDNIYTPQITRIKAMNQQVLRLETDYSAVISEKTINSFLSAITSIHSEIDCILILNYGIGGLFNDLLIQKLLIKLKENFNEIPLIARPDSSNYYIYEGIDLLKINLKKALQLFSIDCCNPTSISIVGNKILNSTKSKHILLPYLDSDSYLISRDIEKLITYEPIIKGPVRSYVSVGSIIMAILSLTFASNIFVQDGVNLAQYGAALSATLPPVRFFDLDTLKNYIQTMSKNKLTKTQF